MKYETLYANDNGTIKVRMTIDGKSLEQDFEADNLDENVKVGMAVFKAELANAQPEPTFTPETVTVKPSELPEV